jgi:hypothetical protein
MSNVQVRFRSPENVSNFCLTPTANPLWSKLLQQIENVVTSIIVKMFFMGYKSLDSRAMNEQKEAIIRERNAFSLPCPNSNGLKMDVLYIPSTSPSRTGNVMVIADTTSYQDRLERGFPSKYKHFLDCGVDIVLWNPTEIRPKQYADDLLCVLKVLKKRKPDQKIVVKGHCATVEPAISAAVHFDSSVSLLSDRGYADALSLTRSFTVLSTIPGVRRILEKQFSCSGMQKLQTFSGKMIFVAPEDPIADQVVYWRGKNLTYEMHHYRKRNGFFKDAFIKLGKESDHWSRWNADEYNQITDELKKIGIAASNCPKFSPDSPRLPRTFFKKTWLPLLAKAWV